VTDDPLLARVRAAVGASLDVEAELGRGGMAVVYRAVDRRLRRPVALKVLPPDRAAHPELRRRFLREAEMAARLSHPHIVPILSAGEGEGLAWIVMEFVAGESLSGRFGREPRLPFDEVRRILRETAEALHHAHRRSVVHRDVKPANLLLEAGTGRVRVTDFGMARAEEDLARLTATGATVGTPAFMSPEQAMGERDIDARSDIYALGVLGYLLCTGRLPFEAPSAATLLMQHLNEPARPVAEVRPEVPAPLALAVDRALVKARDARWPDAAAFAAALEAAPTAASRRSSVEVHPEAPAPEAIDRLAHDTPLPAPPFPELPAGWMREGASRAEGREALREWREAQRRWRAEARGRAAAAPADAPVGVLAEPVWQLERHAPAARIARARAQVVGGVLLLVVLAVINALTSPRFPWVVFPAIAILFETLRRLAALWADGLPVREVFRRPARPGLEATALGALPPGTDPSLAEAIGAGVPAEVMAGPYGARVREAYAGRAAIRMILARLREEERGLLPDIVPTVAALLDRVVTLAQALHALDHEASPGAVDRLRTRVAAAEQEPVGAPERERRLELLRRQMQTLEDLAARRVTLAGQFDHAVLTLETLRLDLTKLRTAGAADAFDAGTTLGPIGDVVRDVRAAADASDAL
jgi:tRNA A-37 threonylcarbamoyl transferase component Bud32